jgi:hypothetical protein
MPITYASIGVDTARVDEFERVSDSTPALDTYVLPGLTQLNAGAVLPFTVIEGRLTSVIKSPGKSPGTVRVKIAPPVAIVIDVAETKLPEGVTFSIKLFFTFP